MLKNEPTKRALELRAQNKSYSQIAKIMGKEGYKTPQGKVLTAPSVFYYVNDRKPRKISPENGKMPQENMPTMIINAVMSSKSLKKETKKRIIDLIVDDFMDAA